MGNTADANSPARDVRIWDKLVKWGHWGNQVGQRREAEIRRYIAGGKHTGINQLGSQFSHTANSPLMYQLIDRVK